MCEHIKESGNSKENPYSTKEGDEYSTPSREKSTQQGVHHVNQPTDGEGDEHSTPSQLECRTTVERGRK